MSTARGEGAPTWFERQKEKVNDEVQYLEQIDALLVISGGKDEVDHDFDILVDRTMETIKNKEHILATDQRSSRILERFLNVLVGIATGELVVRGSDGGKPEKEQQDETQRRAVSHFATLLIKLTRKPEALSKNSSASHVVQCIIERVPIMHKMECKLKAKWLSDDVHPLLDGASSCEGSLAAAPDAELQKMVEIDLKGDNLSFDDLSCAPKSAKSDGVHMEIELAAMKFWNKFMRHGSSAIWDLSGSRSATHVMRSCIHMFTGRGRVYLSAASRFGEAQMNTITVPPDSFRDALIAFCVDSAAIMEDEQQLLQLASTPQSSAFLQEIFFGLSMLTTKDNQDAQGLLSRCIESLLGLEEAQLHVEPYGATAESAEEVKLLEPSSCQLAINAEKLVDSVAGSRFLQVIVKVLNSVEFNIVFTRWAMRRFSFLATHKFGNFVIQDLLQNPNLNASHLEILAAGVKYRKLSKSPTGSIVLKSLFDTAARLQCHGARFISGLLKSLKVENTVQFRYLWLCLVTLKSVRKVHTIQEAALLKDKEGYEEHVEEIPDLFSGMGSAIVQVALSFQPRELGALSNSFKFFATLPRSLLVQIACSKEGAKLFEAIFGSTSPLPQKMTAKLSRNLCGQYRTLARAKFGSFSLMAIYTSSPVDVKKSIAEELLEDYSELRKTRPKLVLRCELEMHHKKVGEWERKQVTASSARKHLGGFLAPNDFSESVMGRPQAVKVERIERGKRDARKNSAGKRSYSAARGSSVKRRKV